MAMVPDHELVFPFGKYKGIPVDLIIKTNPDYMVRFVFPFGEYWTLNEPHIMLLWRKEYGEGPGNATSIH